MCIKPFWLRVSCFLSVASLANQAAAAGPTVYEMSCKEFESRLLDPIGPEQSVFWLGLTLGIFAGTMTLQKAVERSCDSAPGAPTGVQLDPKTCPVVHRVLETLTIREQTGYNPEQLRLAVLTECAKGDAQTFLQAVALVLYDKMRADAPGR